MTSLCDVIVPALITLFIYIYITRTKTLDFKGVGQLDTSISSIENSADRLAEVKRRIFRYGRATGNRMFRYGRNSDGQLSDEDDDQYMPLVLLCNTTVFVKISYIDL